MKRPRRVSQKAIRAQRRESIGIKLDEGAFGGMYVAGTSSEQNEAAQHLFNRDLQAELILLQIESAEDAGRNLARATWVLVLATLVLAAATIILAVRS